MGVIQVNEWPHENTPVVLVLIYAMTQSDYFCPNVSFSLSIHLGVEGDSCEMLQCKELHMVSKNLQIICHCLLVSSPVFQMVRSIDCRRWMQYASHLFSRLSLHM